jgi:hypothetical protein
MHQGVASIQHFYRSIGDVYMKGIRGCMCKCTITHRENRWFGPNAGVLGGGGLFFSVLSVNVFPSALLPFHHFPDHHFSKYERLGGRCKKS